MKKSSVVASLSVALFASAALASTPTAWELNSYRDFLAGRFTALSLTRDGRLTLAPRMDTLLVSDQPVIWSVAAAPDGVIYAATGHRGRVFRIDKSGKAALYWTAGQPEVFALAVDAKGVLYAATSPDGAIYRVEDGKATQLFAPKAKYIWSLVFAPDGMLYAGTGDQGAIFRIEPSGKGEVYYDTGQSHITCLALDGQGRLLAGSEPNGIIYRVTAKNKAFVLYDSSLPEIRTLVAAPDGAVYAAALGGSMSRRALGGVNPVQGLPAGASVSTTPATVTVEAAEDQGGIDIKPKPDSAKSQAPQTGAVAAAAAAPAVEIAGVDKSAIYRINPDNTVESLWTSKDENVYDLVVTGGQVMFATDGQGRVYRLNHDRKVTLVTQTNEGEATRLLATPGGVLAATGDMGKLYRLGAETGASGTYESPVHDANTVARWGRLNWRGEAPEGSRIVFRTRSGNSVRPDNTWSEWSEPLTDPNGSPVKSPNARYIQWKAEFTGAKAALDSVAVAYLPQNTPPILKGISVTSQTSAAAGAAKAAAQAQSGGAYAVTVTDSPDAGAATSSGTPTQAVTRAAAEQLQITWQAEDPDGDRMVYSLWFRGEDEREWKLLKSNLSESTYSFDADSLADGKYLFRVIASDAPSNSPETARTAEWTSAPTLIDRTPPTIIVGKPRRTGAHFEIEFEAADSASPLRRCEYSLDAGPWTPMDPVDGIMDSQRERFLLKLDNLPPGEHLLVFRAIDSANNAGLGKVVVR
jgi:sugar lactone lactonase YvrE